MAANQAFLSEAGFSKLPVMGNDETAEGNGEYFGKFKTDSTHVPEDSDELITFDSDTDDEHHIVVSRQFAKTSWSTVASSGLRLGSLAQKDHYAHDKSPWSSPVAAMANAASFSDIGKDDNDDKEPVPSKAVLSIGSELHGTDQCKPCAWFWKPQGCQNGRECLHCHLCPKREVKARKKMKARDRKAAQAEEEAAKTIAAGVLRPPPGLTQIDAPLRAPPGLFEDETLLCPEIPEVADETLKLCKQLEACSEATTEEGLVEVPSSPEGSEQKTEATSMGSALHLSGHCKPCAWFWKPEGCMNGEDCLHCHLCSKGEVKRRKKQKKAACQDVDEDFEEEEIDQSPELLGVTDPVFRQLQAQTWLIQQQQMQLMQMQFHFQLQEQQMQLVAQRQAAVAKAAPRIPVMPSTGSTVG